MYTKNDVGSIPGKPDLTDAEKQTIADEWNANTAADVPTIADQLAATDAAMPRPLEDGLDAVVALGGTLPQPTLDKMATKKALRAKL